MNIQASCRNYLKEKFAGNNLKTFKFKTQLVFLLSSHLFSNEPEVSYFLFRLCLAFNCPSHYRCLFSTGATDTCQVTVTQPKFQEVDYSMHTVFLTCTFSAFGCSSFPPQVLWFRFLTKKHEDLCTPGCIDQQKYKVHLSKNNILLQISNLTVDDNAVYICGVAFSDSSSPHSKQTGDGTVLTKAGQLIIPS